MKPQQSYQLAHSRTTLEYLILPVNISRTQKCNRTELEWIIDVSWNRTNHHRRYGHVRGNNRQVLLPLLQKHDVILYLGLTNSFPISVYVWFFEIFHATLLVFVWICGSTGKPILKRYQIQKLFSGFLFKNVLIWQNLV